MVEIIVPDVAPEDPVEDIQSADFDVRSLQKKFIAPIDAKRSSAVPSASNSKRLVTNAAGISVAEFIGRQLEDVGFEPLNFTESRAHAFYRVLGLPVMDNSGNIFNPGFDPDLTIKQKEKNQKIIQDISNSTLDIMRKRELEAFNRRVIFENQGLDATIFALVLPIIKPFNVIQDGLGPLEKDEQRFNIKRERRINPLTLSLVQLDGSAIPTLFGNGTHILKPFITDPRIALTVLPDSNQVCAPFLADIDSTRLDCERALDRPQIEEICRMRLNQVKDNTVLVEQAEDLFIREGELLPANERAELADGDLGIKQVVLALLGKNEITQDELEKEIKGLNTIEFLQIDKLTKSMKATIDQLVIAICGINTISSEINWFPAPNRRGPEVSSGLTRAFIRWEDNKFNAPIDARIRELSLKNLQASQSRAFDSKFTEATTAVAGSGTQRFESEFDKLGVFALPYMESATQDTFQEELNNEKEKRESFGKNAGEHLAIVEIVTGEVSGLGLIDILAIYTALWAIPIEVLISLLDDNAFERLFVFNPKLRTQEVLARRQLGESTMAGDEALEILENKIVNLLKFADQLFENAKRRTFEGGKIT